VIPPKAFKASKIKGLKNTYQVNYLIGVLRGQLKIQMQQKRVKKFQKGKL